MADDAVALAVRLEARFDKLERDLKRVGALTDSAVKDAEDRFEKFAPRLPFLTGIFQGIGQELFRQLNPAAIVARLVAVNQALADIGDTAKRVGVDVESLQAIRFAAVSRSSLGGDDFLKDAREFAKLLEEARKEEGALFELFKANGRSVKDAKGDMIGMRDALAIVADLVKNAKTELQKFDIAEKVKLSKEWVPAIEEGGAAFEAAARHAEQTGIVIDREIIEKAREFRTRWNAALETFTTRVQAGMAELIRLFDQLLDKSGPFKDLWNAIAGLIEQTAAHVVALTQGVDALTAAQAQLLLAAKFYDEESNGALRKRLELLAEEGRERRTNTQLAQRGTRITVRPRFNPRGTVIPDSSGGGSDRDAFDRATESLNKRTAALLADAAAVGLATGAQEQFRGELRLLEAAQREDSDIKDEQITKYAELRATMSATQALQKAGIELTDEQSKKFLESTARLGAAAQALKAQQTAFQGVNDALKFGGNQLVDVLDQATQKGFNFGKAMEQVLRSVTKQLLQAAITGEGAFAKILGLSSNVPGGVGGLLSIFSGLGKQGAGAGSGAGTFTFSDFSGRALQLGGHVRPGEWAIAGEHGPEPVFGGRTGLTVQPKMPGSANTFAPTTYIDARGSTLSESQVEAIVARSNRSLAKQVNDNFSGRSNKLAVYGS